MLPPDGEAVGWRMGAPLSFRGEHMGILHVEAEALAVSGTRELEGQVKGQVRP